MVGDESGARDSGRKELNGARRTKIPQRIRALQSRRAPEPRLGVSVLRQRLLQLDGTARLFDLALELLGLFAVDALLDGIRSPVDERLRVLESEPGGGANGLDDLDLLVSRVGEDDVDR